MELTRPAPLHRQPAQLVGGEKVLGGIVADIGTGPVRDAQAATNALEAHGRWLPRLMGPPAAVSCGWGAVASQLFGEDHRVEESFEPQGR